MHLNPTNLKEQHTRSIMPAFRIWQVLCVLGTVGSSLCMNEFEYEESYADDYDNEISLDQGGSQITPCPVDFSRWDKLFIALEDSHMRQNMLLESVEHCYGGMMSLRTQVDKLARGTCQQCVPSLESACRAQAEQASLRLQRSLVELREEEAERERRLNATIHMILRTTHEENIRLKWPEEAAPSEPADGRMANQPTQRPQGLGAAFSLGMKPFPSGPKEQEVASPLDVATMERALVAIATELQRLHLQLNKVIEQAGKLKKDKGKEN